MDGVDGRDILQCGNQFCGVVLLKVLVDDQLNAVETCFFGELADLFQRQGEQRTG